MNIAPIDSVARGDILWLDAEMVRQWGARRLFAAAGIVFQGNIP
jgi:hypothetical protein